MPILIVVDNDMSMEDNKDFVEDVDDGSEGKKDEDGEEDNEHLFIVSALAAMVRLLASVENYIYYPPLFPTSVSQITLAFWDATACQCFQDHIRQYFRLRKTRRHILDPPAFPVCIPDIFDLVHRRNQACHDGCGV